MNSVRHQSTKPVGSFWSAESLAYVCAKLPVSNAKTLIFFLTFQHNLSTGISRVTSNQTS